MPITAVLDGTTFFRLTHMRLLLLTLLCSYDLLLPRLEHESRRLNQTYNLLMRASAKKDIIEHIRLLLTTVNGIYEKFGHDIAVSKMDGS